MARGRWQRTFSEKSKLERDWRGDGEERNERLIGSQMVKEIGQSSLLRLSGWSWWQRIKYVSGDNVGVYVGPHVWDVQVMLKTVGLKSGILENLAVLKKELVWDWTALPSIGNTTRWLVPLPPVSFGLSAECSLFGSEETVGGRCLKLHLAWLVLQWCHGHKIWISPNWQGLSVSPTMMFTW